MTELVNEMVVVHNQEPFTNTLIISKGVGLEHQFVMRLVRKYKTDFEEFGTFDFQSRKSGGRATEFAELNEDQATYLQRFQIRLITFCRQQMRINPHLHS